MIAVHHLSRHYGALKAVQDVSFSINTGEIVGLLGLASVQRPAAIFRAVECTKL